MSCYRRARARCACGRDVSRDMTDIDVRTKSVTVRCTCGRDLDIPLDHWWWISYRINGRVRRLRYAPDRRATETREREILVMVAQGIDPDAEKPSDLALPELVKRYWESPAGQRRRDGYAEKDQGDLEPLLEYLGNIRIGEITADTLERWASAVKDEHTPGTIKRKLAILSSILGWAVRRGYLKARPRFPTIKLDNARTAWATKEQAASILGAIKNLDTRDAVTFAFSTGMRRAEVVGLGWNMVNLEGGVVTLPGELTKNRKTRSIPLNKTAVGVLRRRLTLARPGCRVFHRSGKPMSCGGLSQHFKAAARACGIENLCFHSCRHTAASWLVQAGTDLYTTATLLGHSSIAMVQRYSHLSPTGLKAAVAAAEVPEPIPPKNNDGVRPGETSVLAFNKKAANSSR